MPEQKTAYRPTPANPDSTAARRSIAAAKAAIEDLDDFMDEIDALLEENVLEVLQSYRQRGGE